MEKSPHEFPLGDLAAALEAKLDLIQILKQEFSERQLKRIKRDYHSRKAPYPTCGMTVHPAVGCSNRCLYCYVPRKFVQVSPLIGKEMSFSLLLSPFFFPGPNGTFLALGSITDPFLPQVQKTSIEIIQEVQTHLGNPLQVATKNPFPSAALGNLKSSFLSQICLLVSLSSWKQAEYLEPEVPTSQERLEFVKAWRKEGGSPFVFLRPIIPGVTKEESEELISAIKESSAKGAVLGSLRLSQVALERLQTRIDVTEIKRRLPSSGLSKGFQYIYTQDLKQDLSSELRGSNIQPFYSACCANAASHNVPCVNSCWTNPRFCSDCWNQCSNRQLPGIPDSGEIQEFIQGWLNKRSFATIDDQSRVVNLTVKGSPAMRIGVKRTMETLLRARVFVSPKKVRKKAEE